MTTEIVKTYSDLEVPEKEVQTQRIAINPELLVAARSGRKDILDKLLQPKDVPSRAPMGEFTIAVSEESATQKNTSCLLGVTPDGNTILHIVASRGHLELAQEICHRERSLLVAQNIRLDTPLHCTARVGDDKMASLIILFAKEDKIEARVLTAKNRDDANALHEAVKYNHVHVANVLMEEDDELASKPNCAGMSPLYLAIMMGSLNVAKALLQSSSWEKASLESYAGPNKHTALHVAVRISREAILRRDPTLAIGADDLGRIPLHYAASNGHRDIVELLLKNNPSTAYQPDARGFFPIHVATMMGNLGVVDQILEQCPDTDELSDKEGRNFLHAAFKWGRLDFVKKIICKRPGLRKLLNDQDDMGNTPLHTAVISGNQESVYFLMRDKTVHVNIANKEGLTPLDLAFLNLDKGMSVKTNAACCILSCLAFTKALFGVPPKLLACKKDVSSSDGDKTKPSSVDEVKEKSPSDEDKKKPSVDDKAKEDASSDEEKELKRWLMQDEELKKQLDVPKNLALVTVLIATVTFAAGVAVPGGYIDDDHPGHGTSVLAKEYAFKVFQVSDAFAFVCSILATFWLMDAGTSTVDKHARRRALSFAWWCLWVAFSGMSTAFAMGIHATLAHSCKSISILLCIIALATPILANVVSHYNLYKFRKTVGIRQGYRHWIWPTTSHPHVENILRPILMPRGAIISYLLPILGSYVIFFLLPMLLARKS